MAQIQVFSSYLICCNGKRSLVKRKAALSFHFISFKGGCATIIWAHFILLHSFGKTCHILKHSLPLCPSHFFLIRRRLVADKFVKANTKRNICIVPWQRPPCCSKHFPLCPWPKNAPRHCTSGDGTWLPRSVKLCMTTLKIRIEK